MIGQGPLVVVVEDDDLVARAVARLLLVSGYRTRRCASAREYLEGRPDEGDPPGCLVVDVHMPDVSGLELQRVLRVRGVRTPIVFITGAGDSKTSRRALQEGGAAFLPKPFTDQELLAAVGRAVSVRLDPSLKR
jgi:FixJ family two-component response regulator